MHTNIPKQNITETSKISKHKLQGTALSVDWGPARLLLHHWIHMAKERLSIEFGMKQKMKKSIKGSKY